MEYLKKKNSSILAWTRLDFTSFTKQSESYLVKWKFTLQSNRAQIRY